MDRQILEKHLAQVERHVEAGGRHVERQRALVAALERYGHDTTAARKLLASFEAIQQTHIEDRDRVAKELQGLTAHGGRAALHS